MINGESLSRITKDAVAHRATGVISIAELTSNELVTQCAHIIVIR